eukprot:6895265-Pyramimonas_sp.AAC.1
MAIFRILISSEGIMKLSCDGTNTPANSAGRLARGTIQRACQLSAHMCVSKTGSSIARGKCGHIEPSTPCRGVRSYPGKWHTC